MIEMLEHKRTAKAIGHRVEALYKDQNMKKCIVLNAADNIVERCIMFSLTHLQYRKSLYLNVSRLCLNSGLVC